MNERNTLADRVNSILDYWFRDLDDSSRLDSSFEPFKTCYSRWYGKDAAIDAEIRGLFESDLARVTSAGSVWDDTLAEWASIPDGLLALTILLDQLPRNMFRDSARMYEQDPLALLVASRALEDPRYREASLVRQMFLIVPFMHAENVTLQRSMLARFRALTERAEHRSPDNVGFFRMGLRYAERHLEVVASYGRFPHRNAILGRVSTPAEELYLAGDNPGF